jgi:hypothetical protein
MRSVTGRVAAAMAVFFAWVAMSPARGALIVDSKTPMAWDDLVGCELVVVGKYASHKDDVMTIKVERVLKGPAKAGDLMNVKMEHWWSVETGPVGFEPVVPDQKKADGKTRICYKVQIMNPGPLVPEPVLDADQSAIFFFSSHDAALERPGQIRSAALADGWEQALAQKPTDLVFRLGQGVDEKMTKDAIQELKEKREGKVLDILVQELGDTSSRDTVDRFHAPCDAQAILVAIGDQGGDVYDRARRAFVEKPRDLSERYRNGRCVTVMSHANPGRALPQLWAWISGKDSNTEVRQICVMALAWAATPDAMRMAISLLPDKDVGNSAMYAIQAMLVTGQTWPEPTISAENRTKLRAVARKELKGTKPPENWSKDSKAEYVWILEHDLEENEAGK